MSVLVIANECQGSSGSVNSGVPGNTNSDGTSDWEWDLKPGQNPSSAHSVMRTSIVGCSVLLGLATIKEAWRAFKADEDLSEQQPKIVKYGLEVQEAWRALSAGEELPKTETVEIGSLWTRSARCMACLECWRGIDRNTKENDSTLGSRA